MKKGSKRPCRCSLCERPRIVQAWQWGVALLLDLEGTTRSRFVWVDTVGPPGPTS